jgi:hypothetical protein
MTGREATSPVVVNAGGMQSCPRRPFSPRVPAVSMKSHWEGLYPSAAGSRSLQAFVQWQRKCFQWNGGEQNRDCDAGQEKSQYARPRRRRNRDSERAGCGCTAQPTVPPPEAAMGSMVIVEAVAVPRTRRRDGFLVVEGLGIHQPAIMPHGPDRSGARRRSDFLGADHAETCWPAQL